MTLEHDQLEEIIRLNDEVEGLQKEVLRLEWALSRGLAAPDGGPSATYYDRMRNERPSA